MVRHEIEYDPSNGIPVKRRNCVACKLEHNICLKSDIVHPVKHGTGYCSVNYLGICNVCKIGLHTIEQCNSMFHQIQGLKRMSCFDIYHSERCKGLWLNEEDCKGRVRRLVLRTHPVYKDLSGLYGINAKKTK